MGVLRAAWVGLVLSWALAWAPGAAADESLTASGSIVYTWHGDPARGCAQVGVCGVQGAVVIQPRGGADLFSFGRSSGEVNFFENSATVRVRGADGGTCVDQAGGTNGSPGTVGVSWNAGGAVRATFADVSSGRCAGPVAQDLGGLRLRGRRTAGPRARFDLRGSAPFVAGPFSGRLVSTVRLSPERPPSGGSSSSSGSSGASAPGLQEQIELSYRLSADPGALDIPFEGESGPFCAVLDTCGGSGSLSLSVPASTMTLHLFGARTVRRRVTRRRVIADFLRGRLGPVAGPSVDLPGARISERWEGTGTAACSDALSAPRGAIDFMLTASGRGSAVPLQLIDYSGSDPLRTHCPGPEFSDVFGMGQTFGEAEIARRQLLERSTTVMISPHGGWSVPGYTGSRGGGIRLTLSLVKIQASTVGRS
jgi:hypothetical protein